jgi:EAL domain-containing protein (putative c-di-GMP-specific phosphodiesterase class I)
VAEETGLIGALDDHILRTAVRDANIATAAAGNPELMVWVNASPRQLVLPDYADSILRILDEQALPPGRLGIEVVESALVDSSDLLRTLQRLAATGVRIAIDDFGTGYSSLARLHRYPVDVLKIDRSFVSRLNDPAARPIVTAIVTLAHSLGATASGEGVETAEQLHVLRDLGVDSACGFYLARPGTLENLADPVRAGSARARRPDAIHGESPLDPGLPRPLRPLVGPLPPRLPLALRRLRLWRTWHSDSLPHVLQTRFGGPARMHDCMRAACSSSWRTARTRPVRHALAPQPDLLDDGLTRLGRSRRVDP